MQQFSDSDKLPTGGLFKMTLKKWAAARAFGGRRSAATYRRTEGYESRALNPT